MTLEPHSDGTVGKALEVLDKVASFGRPVRFSEILNGSPFPKASLYRFLQTLTNQGLLAFDPERQTYAPGMRLVRLAHAAWQQSSLAPPAHAHLSRLSVAVGETVHLAQLENGQVLYVDKRIARVPIQMYSQAGKVGPAYCTGVGKAMLAFLDPEPQARAIAQQSFHRYTDTTLTTPEALRADLDRIRQDGLALDRGEHEPGILCVAVPILSRRGRLLGGLSVTTLEGRKPLDDLIALAPLLRETAHLIAGEAEDWRFPEQHTQLTTGSD